MGTELEWKYAAGPEAHRLLTERYSGENWRTVQMETQYYDTPDRALSRRRLTFRIRKENDASIACLKSPGKGRARGEWEIPCEDPSEAIDLLVEQGAPLELAELTCGKALTPLCGARFTRKALTLELTEGGSVELCLDEGELFGGESRAPLCEIEVELKSGAPFAAEGFARELARRLRLKEEPQSKFQRALALADQRDSQS